MGSKQPNILFLLSDQHSFRFLGNRSQECGGENVETPSLDKIARSATRFDTAYCSSPICTPSRLSLLTGRHVPDAGGWDNFHVLPPHLETIPQTLSKAGYTTSLLGKMHLGGNRQFVGFDARPYGDLTGKAGHQAEPPNEPFGDTIPDWKSLITDAGIVNIPESLLQEQNVAQETIAYLREQQHGHPSQPWFLCASFSRPHWPRTAPRRYFEKYWPNNVSSPPVKTNTDTQAHPLIAGQKEGIKDITNEQSMRARAAYFASVEYLDEILGDMLATLDRDGLLENTIVVYTSDHGETAGEHGLWGKCTYHEASTRVPLFIQLPDQRSGVQSATTIETPVSLVDLYPTLCGLINEDRPENLDGVDLSGAIHDGSEPNREPVVTDCFATFESPQTDYRMIRDGKYKYIQFRDAPELLFDLKEDPLEQHNLAATAKGDDRDALETLRDLVSDSLDFVNADKKRKRDRRLQEQYELDAPESGPNQYFWPDGRIIDADTPIYDPHVVSEDPQDVYDDYPS